jgi:hypothetical protein
MLVSAANVAFMMQIFVIVLQHICDDFSHGFCSDQWDGIIVNTQNYDISCFKKKYDICQFIRGDFFG